MDETHRAGRDGDVAAAAAGVAADAANRAVVEDQRLRGEMNIAAWKTAAVAVGIDAAAAHQFHGRGLYLDAAGRARGSVGFQPRCRVFPLDEYVVGNQHQITGSAEAAGADVDATLTEQCKIVCCDHNVAAASVALRGGSNPNVGELNRRRSQNDISAGAITNNR